MTIIPHMNIHVSVLESHFNFMPKRLSIHQYYANVKRIWIINRIDVWNYKHIGFNCFLQRIFLLLSLRVCSMKSSSPSLEGVQLLNWVCWWRRVISLRFKTLGLHCILVPSENHNIPLTSNPPPSCSSAVAFFWSTKGNCGVARGCLWSTEVLCSHVHTKPTWHQDFRLWVNKTIAKTFPYSVHKAIERNSTFLPRQPPLRICSMK